MSRGALGEARLFQFICQLFDLFLDKLYMYVEESMKSFFMLNPFLPPVTLYYTQPKGKDCLGIE